MCRTIVAVCLLLVVALPVLAEQRELSLGTVYDSLGALSCGERRTVYAGYSREQQLALWTLHLQTFLADHPNLTSAQRALVREGLDMIATGALDRAGDPKARSLMLAFKERAQRQFDKETFQAAFVKLGGRRDAAAGVQRAERVGAGARLPDCNCDGEEDCAVGDDCNLTAPCFEVINCGPMGMDWCFGRCQ